MGGKTSLAVAIGAVLAWWGCARVDAAVSRAIVSVPPSCHASAGSTIHVPISVRGADGASGFDLTLRFDSAVLRALSVSKTGIAAAQNVVLESTVSPGTVHISLHGTVPFAGSGEIAEIEFQVVGSPVFATDLTFTQVAIDGEVSPAAPGNGAFLVDPPPAVLSMPDTAQGGPGQVVQVPISLAPADGAYGIDLTLQYNASVIQAQSVTASGLGAAAGFGVSANLTTPGTIVVSTYATGDSLVGSGEFLSIQFHVVGQVGQTSPLTFVSWSINEDRIPTTNDNGLFTIGCAGAPNGTPCNDGNSCSVNDTCSAGVCTGTPAPPPAAINDSVRINRAPTDATITWIDPPGSYNVYRGSVAAGTAFSYDHSCLTSNIAGSASPDTATPLPGQLFYYLVSRVNACHESSLGTNSAGVQRPNNNACAPGLSPGSVSKQ